MIDFEKYRCICLDSSPFIYFIDKNPKYIAFVDQIFKHITDGVSPAVSSYLSLLEVLVKPIKEHMPDIAALYRNFMLNSHSLTLYPLDQKVAETAAGLKAKYDRIGIKIKTPDAIQVATGLINGADVFVTNDKQLKNIKELDVIVLEDLVL